MLISRHKVEILFTNIYIYLMFFETDNETDNVLRNCIYFELRWLNYMAIRMLLSPIS